MSITVKCPKCDTVITVIPSTTASGNNVYVVQEPSIKKSASES